MHYPWRLTDCGSPAADTYEQNFRKEKSVDDGQTCTRHSRAKAVRCNRWLCSDSLCVLLSHHCSQVLINLTVGPYLSKTLETPPPHRLRLKQIPIIRGSLNQILNHSIVHRNIVLFVEIRNTTLRKDLHTHAFIEPHGRIVARNI